MKKFLIVKTSSLGDIIHAFPVVNYLKNKFPDAQIDWVVEEHFSELVKAHPHINQVFCINTHAWRKFNFKGILTFRNSLRKNSYDAIFDLQGNTKSGFCTLQGKSPIKVGFAKESIHEWPNLLFTNRKYNPQKGLNVREENLFLVQSFFNEKHIYNDSAITLKISQEQSAHIDSILANEVIQSRSKVMICPGSAWPNKRMTEESLASLLQQMQKEMQCGFMFIWGSPGERAVSLRLQQQFPRNSILVERLPLSTLQNLMSRIDWVVAMDSLPLHLAGTTKTSTLSIFGASSANKYRPIGSQHHTFQGACPYGRIFERRCPILRTCPTGACIRNLNGTEVFDAFLKNK
jgi:heptosyltransferase I